MAGTHYKPSPLFRAHTTQAARANAISQAQDLGEQLHFRVADALAQPFEDGAFDLVWSMESGEHMPDKK